MPSKLIKDLLSPPKYVPHVYSSKTLSNSIVPKMLPYQIKPTAEAIKRINEKIIHIKLDDTGTGKTFMALAMAKEINRVPFVICPLSVLSYWAEKLEEFEMETYGIVNLETFKNGRIYRDFTFKNKMKCDFVQEIEDEYKGVRTYYQWDLPEDAILIIDEAHKCKAPSTDNGKLLMSAKQLIDQRIPVLLLSATIAEKQTDMKIPFYLFDFIHNVREFNSYVKSLKYKYPQYHVHRLRGESKTSIETRRENAKAMIIYEEIREYISRIRIKDLGDMFPSNQWCAQLFTTESAAIICQKYAELEEHLKALKGNQEEEKENHHLACCTQLKMEIEYLKIPIFIEQAQIMREQGKSVIIFVNYTRSLEIIADRLEIRCKVYGLQSQTPNGMDERRKGIELFQTNKERMIICNSRAGGQSISLHDTDGGYPRGVLLNFTDKAGDLLQCLGRAARAKTKSPVIQRIICAANVPYEQTVMKNINRKLMNISAINDGDLNSYRYKVKKIRQERLH
jgi:SNF2 family DNA or RNA helicase